MSALFDLPFGDEDDTGSGHASVITRVLSNIEVAPILTIGSGRPVDPLTGLDSSRTHTFPLSSRPFGFARNSLTTPSTAVLDVRLLKFFKIGEHGKLDFVRSRSIYLTARTLFKLALGLVPSLLP